MTYLMFLVTFVLLPLVILILTVRHRITLSRSLLGLYLVIISVALPAALWWDHQAAVWGMWQWNVNTTLPLRLWHLPLEEIAFIAALVLLIVTWYLWLRTFRVQPSRIALAVNIAFGLLVIIFVGYSMQTIAMTLWAHAHHPMYLTHLMRWGVPILLMQWGIGGQHLWRERQSLLLSTIGIVTWFILADALALHFGLWSFAPADLIGQYVGNVPIEEVLFFCTVTLLVEQTAIIYPIWHHQVLHRVPSRVHLFQKKVTSFLAHARVHARFLPKSTPSSIRSSGLC
jgi:lycopene cyclase domain-containing protein